jgi:hypothetical protein
VKPSPTLAAHSSAIDVIEQLLTVTPRHRQNRSKVDVAAAGIGFWERLNPYPLFTSLLTDENNGAIERQVFSNFES